LAVAEVEAWAVGGEVGAVKAAGSEAREWRAVVVVVGVGAGAGGGKGGAI